VPKPGTRASARHHLAVLQEAMASAGFDPRFRRAGDGAVEVTLRDCPFRELLDDHRELVCSIHQGLVEGMVGALEPPMALTAFEPLTERTTCRLEVSALRTA
jgi:predicted ArsR family transcriptional regulator